MQVERIHLQAPAWANKNSSTGVHSHYRITERYQLRLGRQRQVWLIPIADERVGVQVKL